MSWLWAAWVVAVGLTSFGFAYVATHAEAPTRTGRWRLTWALLAAVAGLCTLAVIGGPVGR